MAVSPLAAQKREVDNQRMGGMNAATSVSPARSAKVSQRKRRMISITAPMISHVFCAFLVMTVICFDVDSIALTRLSPRWFTAKMTLEHGLKIGR